MQFDH